MINQLLEKEPWDHLIRNNVENWLPYQIVGKQIRAAAEVVLEPHSGVRGDYHILGSVPIDIELEATKENIRKLAKVLYIDNSERQMSNLGGHVLLFNEGRVKRYGAHEVFEQDLEGSTIFEIQPNIFGLGDGDHDITFAMAYGAGKWGGVYIHNEYAVSPKHRRIHKLDGKI